MGNAVKYFFLFFVATVVIAGAWLYLNGEFEIFYDERRCSDIETYEEYGEERKDYQGDYTKTYGDRIREVIRGCP